MIFVGQYGRRLAEQVRMRTERKRICLHAGQCQICQAAWIRRCSDDLAERSQPVCNHGGKCADQGDLAEQVAAVCDPGETECQGCRNIGISDDYVEHGNVDVLRREART